MEPQVDVRVEYIDVPNRPGHKVIAMHFDGWAWGMVPYTYHGCPYYKVESTTKEMPRDMTLKMALKMALKVALKKKILING